ncbi:creatinine amidohydrolase [Angulomicrobium tetraedrale]|uniref:Creatinine amidohydrolase n=1 Tax=Ancylobacter tetraedralis TaxID=217068 RepID=A0A839ZBZ3_9HYPH|nr:creatininase family protein [Ancylobacter tetraedralis]MBB3772310.1 creatinine amidohydrolase [Ancylobacter tetraedralis]
MPPKRFWTELSWTDFAAGDVGNWIAVLPVAAVEQHGPHLPVGVDSFIAEGYLKEVARLLPAETPAVFLPVQSIGKSNEHIDFPGTLTLSAETVIRAWTEIGESVHRAGVRKLVVVNSHGGNVPILDIVARDLRARLGMLVVTISWHRFGYPEGLFTAQERQHGIHAAGVETSLMLAFRPDTVKESEVRDFAPVTLAMEQEFSFLRAGTPAGFGWMAQDIQESGAMGDATQASLEKGEACALYGARAFVELLADVHRFDLKRLAEGPLGGGAA